MQKLLKFEKWLPKVSAAGFYNTDCISGNLNKIFGEIIQLFIHVVHSLHAFFTNFIYLIKKTKFKRNLYYKV